MTATASLAIVWTVKSSNAKTGPIPVSTTDRAACAPECPFMGNGCYAEGGPLGYIWREASKAGPDATFKNGRSMVRTISWDALCENVAALPARTLWRHNQAGDLPHMGGTIDAAALSSLVAANKGRKGFTYSHHNVLQSAANRRAIEEANLGGFVVNLSGNTLAHADKLADLGIGPVVVVLPASVHGPEDIRTPAGRKVVVCPATYTDVGPGSSCAMCGLCAHAARKTIVGFPAHGQGKARASRIAA